MFKKILSLTLFISIMVTLVVVPAFADNIFPDVTEENYPWAVNEINEMVEMSIIKGYTDGTFKPDKSVSKIEALVLTSRILGYTNEANADFVELASTLYEEEMKPYDVQYKGEISYLLYKGVLSVDELKYYIGGSNATTALKRYEAAVLLTKAMKAEAKIGSSDMPYTDEEDIPATAKDYVAYVTEVGLMKGMNVYDDVNEFVPNFDVNRAQIAVLLYRMMDIIDETVVFGTVSEVNTDKRTIMFKTDDATPTSGISIPYDSTATFIIDGYSSTLDKIMPASKIAVIKRGGVLFSVEVITVIPDEIYEGIVTSTKTSTDTVTISMNKIDETDKREFIVPKNITVVYENNIGSVSDIKKSDFLVVELKDGKVVFIEAVGKERTIKGTVSKVTFEPTVTFEITLTDGTVEEYEVADETSVKRNGRTVSISDVLVGDKVTIVLMYEQISTVTATGKSSVVTGTIDEFTVATLPKIKIRTSENNVSTYSIARDAEYVIDGVENANIYSLRLGASVTVNLESETVVKITSFTPTTNTSMLGTIETINKAYGFFVLEVPDENTGNVIKKQVFTKKLSLTIINGSDGKTKSVSDLTAGMRVSVTGVESMGAFEATTIVIQP